MKSWKTVSLIYGRIETYRREKSAAPRIRVTAMTRVD